MKMNAKVIGAGVVIGAAFLFLRGRNAAAAGVAKAETDGDRITDTANDRAPATASGAKTSAAKGGTKAGSLASGAGKGIGDAAAGAVSAIGTGLQEFGKFFGFGQPAVAPPATK